MNMVLRIHDYPTEKKLSTAMASRERPTLVLIAIPLELGPGAAVPLPLTPGLSGLEALVTGGNGGSTISAT